MNEISRATLGRLPVYLNYVKTLDSNIRNISATVISKELNFGEVQVRKDLNSVCGMGRPKIGYDVAELEESLENALNSGSGTAVIIGGGKLGRALLDYGGFCRYGLTILAAFDKDPQALGKSHLGKPIMALKQMESFCKENDVKIGIIAVPGEAAQQTGELLYSNNIKAIWCFAPCKIDLPPDAVVQYENLELSLAHLKMKIK